MQNIRPSIEEVAKKVAATFVENDQASLTDLVIEAAQASDMNSKQASALVWLVNRHAFAGRMAKGASDEFKLADPGVVKLAMQKESAESEGVAAPALAPVKAQAMVTSQSGSRIAPMEMGPFIVSKLKNSDTELKGEESATKTKMRRIIERIQGLLGGVKKAGLDGTESFSQELAKHSAESRFLITKTLEALPYEKQAFISRSQEQAYVSAARYDLDTAFQLADEAAELRKRAKQIEADRASIQEQIAVIKKEGLTR